MGVGNYTERDVREAARAFTGWTNDVLVFKFDADQHDFGREDVSRPDRDRFDGEDIIDIILAQPVTAEFVAAKLYRFFVREEIADAVKTELGRTFRESGYQMKPLLKRIFLSKDFYSQPSYATQIKSPVHLVVSTYKKMGLARGADDSRLRPHDRQPRTVAVRSAERRGLGRRPHLDHAVDAAPARQPVPRRAVPGRQGLPPARSRRCRPTDARVGERLAQGMNITEATKEGDAAMPSRT